MAEGTGDLRVLIFPHLYLSEPRIKRVAGLFPRIFVGEPWYLEAEVIKEAQEFISKIHPPTEYKPPAEFKKTVAEVRMWAQTRGELNFRDFLKTFALMDQDQDTMWEIVSLIKGGKASLPKEEGIRPSALWHLALYLYFEFEKNQTAADVALQGIACLPSPLEGALDELVSTPPSALDAALSSGLTPMGHEQLEFIVDAWVRLFGTGLKQFSLVVTFSQEVFQFVKDRFEESVSGDIISAEPLRSAEILLPDCSKLPFEKIAAMREGGFFEISPTFWHNLLDSLSGEKPPEAKELDFFFDYFDRVGSIEKTASIITLLPGDVSSGTKSWLRHFAGKGLLYI